MIRAHVRETLGTFYLNKSRSTFWAGPNSTEVLQGVRGIVAIFAGVLVGVVLLTAQREVTNMRNV